MEEIVMLHTLARNITLYTLASQNSRPSISPNCAEITAYKLTMLCLRNKFSLHEKNKRFNSQKNA